MLKPIAVEDLKQNVFSLIGKQWMLITAGTPEKCNPMTASWGGLGVLWNEPAATCYVRPQRYTLELMEEQDYYTLCFFGEEYRKALALCGSKSGRDVDKVKECGFTVLAGEGNAPYFAEAELVLVCRKQYWQDMEPANILDKEADAKWYPEKDYHRIYVGKIVEAYQNV